MFAPTAARSASISSSSPSRATARNSSYSTEEPPSARIRTTPWASSGSASTRTSSRSRRDSLSPVLQPSLRERAISSTKKALPSLRLKIRSTRSRSGSAPLIPVSWACTSPRVKRDTSMRRTSRIRSTSARKGRSGWRRWMSSER
ncbi:hypothetical protein SANTM175S_01898 [Streptomyces antimycoticus]